MFDERELGKRIKELRLKKSMTLVELSEKTGFTQGYLSKMENSAKAPPVSTLIALIKCLGATISDIFGEVEEKSSIVLVKKNERQAVAHSANEFGYSYETLAHKFNQKHMEPLILTLPLKAKNKLFFQHNGEELILVLEGKMKFFYGDKELVVEKGDCLYFDASVPHTGLCQGKKKTKCLIVIYTPEK